MLINNNVQKKTERNRKIRALPIIIEHCHNSSYKFIGWMTGREVRRVSDKIGVFIGIYSATKNVTLLTTMKPEDKINRIAENQIRLHYTANR